MKSTFFHIGVNLSLERRFKDPTWTAPRLDPKGELPYVPLPRHVDPDFPLVTYGEPWGRIDKLSPGDCAFFIESGLPHGTIAPVRAGAEWAYFIVAFFITEKVYKVRNKVLDPLPPDGDDAGRVAANAHYLREDPSFSVLLGERSLSRIFFDRPVMISKGQYPFREIAFLLDISPHAKGYWFKRWFDEEQTESLLHLTGS